MNKEPKIYADRKAGGKAVARLLHKFSGADTVVLGLPRGGVVVAAEIAIELGCALDIIFAGKLRTPFNPELAIGAVTEDGAVYLNKATLTGMHITQDYIEKEKKERLDAVKERLKLYRRVREKVGLEGRTVILADDGLATGSTMISAIQAVHAAGAGKIIVAVPGGPADTVERIKGMAEVDEVVCPVIPPLFYAVGQLYLDFAQVEDYEVIEILKRFSGQAGQAR